MSKRSKKSQRQTRSTGLAKRNGQVDKAVPDVKPHQTGILRAAYKQESYSGPLPHPDILARYDEIVPGCAERIIDQFIAQSTHRRSLESKAIDHEIRQSSLGLWTGYSLGLIGLVGGLYAVIQGREIGGLGTIVTALAGLVGVFVYGNYSRKDERIKKAEISSGNS